MSKKIIYLLSLLMALSLVFASCKKNGITGVQGNPNQETETKNPTGGLYTEWEKLQNETIINDYAVIGESGQDYFRNPVIVALGGPNVLMIYEKRINYPGSANDIGVNGDKPVDLQYSLSKNAGDTFDISQKLVGETSSEAAKKPADKAVSAPVVFYQQPATVKNGTGYIYIIASAGAGISRTDTAYANRTPQSSLKYTVGTVSFDDQEKVRAIAWDDWTDLNLGTAIQSSGALFNKQFGTQTGRGIYKSDNSTGILGVITADQGVNGSGAKEMMGVIFFEVSDLQADSKGTPTFKPTKVGEVVAFAQGNGTANFSEYKEAKAVGITGTTVTYLALPNPDGGDGYMAKGDNTAADNATKLEGLKGSEGAFGFLKLEQTTKPWFGANEYEPDKYTSGGGSGSSSAQDAILFSHVQTRTGQNHLYMLNDSTYRPKAGSLQVAKSSKSCSIDVLPDGTIIMATEKEYRYDNGLKFNIFFSRYSQAYLSDNIEK